MLSSRMSFDRRTRRPEETTHAPKLGLQRDANTPAPTITQSVTPASSGHHFGSYAIVAPKSRDQHALADSAAPTFPISNLQPSPWVNWGAKTPSQPNPMTVLQRDLLGFTHDLEKPRDPEHPLGTEYATKSQDEHNASSETSEGSSTPDETMEVQRRESTPMPAFDMAQGVTAPPEPEMQAAKPLADAVKALLEALGKVDLREVSRVLGGLSEAARTKALQEVIKAGSEAVKTRAEGILAMLSQKVLNLPKEIIERYKGQTIKAGEWEPPGKQDIGYYVGNDAHKQITDFYAGVHSKAPIGEKLFTNNFPMKSIVKKFTLPTDISKLTEKELILKPDIFNIETLDLYEIKPAQSIGIALTEAVMYQELFKKVGIPAQLGPSNDPGVNGIVSGAGGHLLFMSPLPGVIVYQKKQGDYNPQTVPATVPAQDEKQEQSDADFMKGMEKITGLTGTALIIYLIISEGSRLFPPRNLLPVP
jgi:hypothetical protein